ncbi:MAG: hypothetical protein H6660_19410 [Ardenticatenaceae bacterium]|nr:hypothetical protein [Ardenticatenaceae bacterium]
MSRVVVSMVALLILLGIASALAPTVAAESLPSAQVIDALQPQPAQLDETTPETGSSSSLPEGLSRIFASLGLYIVTMFTMAIGTEITVDVVKLVVGLRSKPKAKDTLEEYETMLPGTLKNLGIGAEARHNLEYQLAAMKEVLQPVLKVETVVTNLQQRQFNEAFVALISQEEKTDRVAAAKSVALAQVEKAFAQLRIESSLGQFIAGKLQAEVDELIEKAALKLVEATPEAFFADISVVVNGRFAETITNWAEEQLTDLRTLSYQTAYRTYTLQILPVIEATNLGPATEKAVKRQFEDFLSNLRQSQEADIYLDSVNKLLLEVERQRDELASAWRKWFGRIYQWLQQRLSWLPASSPRLDPTISSPDEAATKLLAIQRRDKKEDNDRIQQLRLVSVIVGIFLAYLLQIDSADLLRDLFPPDANFLSMSLIPANSAVFLWLQRVMGMDPHPFTAGIILTGLAASAGSGFWHDQLTRLQSVKGGVESAYAALQPVIAQIQSPQNKE